VRVGYGTIRRFCARHAITRKKDRTRLRAGPPRHLEATRGLVRRPARSRSRTLGHYRRDLGFDQHGADPRSLPPRRTPACRLPHGHWKTTTFVAGLTTRGIIAPFVLEGRSIATLSRPMSSASVFPNCARATSSSWTTCPATRGGRAPHDRGGEREPPLPAVLFARFQSDRIPALQVSRADGLLQGVEKHRRQDKGALDHLGVLRRHTQKVDRGADRAEQKNACKDA
jgi:hypothetical protein